MSSNALNSKLELRSKNLNSMATLVSKGQQDSDTYRSLEKAVNEMDEDIAMLRKLEGMMEKANIAAQPAKIADAAATAVRSVVPGILSAFSAPSGESAEQRRSKLNAAFRGYFKTGAFTEAEQRDITSDTSTGNPLVPQEYSKDYTDTLSLYGPIANLVKQYDSKGRPTKIVTVDASQLPMTLIAQGSAAPSFTPAVSSSVPNTDSLVLMVQYAKEELADSAEPLTTFIKNICGLPVARAIEQAITLGVDLTSAKTALPNQPTGGLLAAATSGATSTGLAAGPSFSDLMKLYSSFTGVNAAYIQPGVGSWMVSPNTYAFLASQVDSTGRALYKIDHETGRIKIAGLPVYVNAALPNYTTASSKSVLLGDFKSAFTLVNSGLQMKVTNERFAELNVGAAILYIRLGGALGVSGAVKSLTIAAS